MKYNLKTYKELPKTPGIYQMINKEEQIIYVGKAKNLKNRVSSYFSNKQHDFKTKVMVSKIETIQIIQTNTEKEALILENQLIKTLKPKYNILLKDDKTFPYIKVTVNEPFPRIIVTRSKRNDGAKYYGPYPSIGSSRGLKKTLYDLFPIRDCKLTITLTEQQPKCLLLDIGKCIGPCIYKTCKPEYDELVRQLDLLLMGKNKSLLRSLKKQMLDFSNQQAYEKAAVIRDKINQINSLLESQQVCLDSTDNIQIWTYIANDQLHYMLVQEIIDGKLIAQHGFYEQLDIVTKDMFIEQTFLEFSSEYIVMADHILVTENVYRVLDPIIREYSQYRMSVPERGFKKELVDQASRYAKMALSRLVIDTTKSMDDKNVLYHLQQTLDLKKPPTRIIGFDISHIQGEFMVASAVYFVNGKPEKKLYRKFNINTIEGHSNDPAAIAEAVYRRLKLCVEQNEPLPDLLCIDGGRGQLNFAYKSVKALGLTDQIELIGLAKREEEIYQLYKLKPLKLPRHHEGLRLLQHIRDESHRFANLFRHQKHRKALHHSVLLDIPGLGKQRINKLYKQFQSIEKIKKADVNDIAKVGNIGLKLSRTIKEILNKHQPDSISFM